MRKMIRKGFCADIVLMNGKILTIDKEDSIVEAVAISGNRIISTGTNNAILDWVVDTTKKIDLDGKTALPGLIDSHMHPGSYGAFRVRGVRCGPDLNSINELLKILKIKAQNTTENQWILGYALNEIKLGGYPSLKELDCVTPKNPLYIQRRDGHIGIVNSLALNAGGITKDSTNPPYGIIDRDNYGIPTGVLESAKDIVYSKIPENTIANYYARATIVDGKISFERKIK